MKKIIRFETGSIDQTAGKWCSSSVNEFNGFLPGGNGRKIQMSLSMNRISVIKNIFTFLGWEWKREKSRRRKRDFKKKERKKERKKRRREQNSNQIRSIIFSLLYIFLKCGINGQLINQKLARRPSFNQRHRYHRRRLGRSRLGRCRLNSGSAAAASSAKPGVDLHQPPCEFPAAYHSETSRKVAITQKLSIPILTI